jgi:hypothetical protein
MEEAIKKVLEMLEEGKISPEEAEKLIKAIKESGKKEPESDFSVQNLGEFVSEIVSKSLKTAFSSAFKFAKGGSSEKINMEIPAREKLKITAQGSEIEIKSEQRETVIINGIGVKLEALDKKENETSIEVIAGEAEILMPSGKDIELIVQGGDTEVKGDFKSINVNIQGDDAEFYSDFEKAEIKIMGGDFTLTTSKKPLKINIMCLGGDFELPEGFKKEDGYYIYGDQNHREIEVEIQGGDFELKFKE